MPKPPCLCRKRPDIRCDDGHCDIAHPEYSDVRGDLSRCVVCWQWLHDDALNRAWGGSGAPEPLDCRREAPYPPLPCVHLGAHLDTVQCPECPAGTRLKVFSCAVHGRCTASKEIPGAAVCRGCHQKEPIAPTVQRVEGLPAGRSFNGSIAEHEGKIYLCYRKFWGNARLGLVELDAAWRPVGLAKTLALGKLAQDRHAQEDPRLFLFRGRLHVSYSGCNWSRPSQQVSICYARLDDALDVEESFCPAFDARQDWEKNWGWFEHSGDLYTVHTINPHRVLLHNGRHLWEVPGGGQGFPASAYGHMRGGASPVRVGGEYYSFFHGCTDADRRLYSVGLYTFSAEPPFRPLRWCRTPLLWPVLKESPGPHVANVVFPGGAVLREGRWHVCFGYYDEQVRIASWDAGHIEKLLEPV